jgi:hypothetical protein
MKNILILLNIGILVYGPILIALTLVFLERYVGKIKLPIFVWLGLVSIAVML